MPIHNADIADLLDQVADLLEIQDANPFRVRAYRNSARTVRDLGRDIKEMVEAGEDLSRLPSVGEDIAEKIAEIVETGHLGQLDELRQEVPPALAELLEISGLGPKRVSTLYRELGVRSREDLYEACQQGRVHELSGFGKKTEENIMHALEEALTTTRRFKLAIAVQYTDDLVAYLEASQGVHRVEIAGSYRRAKETVGDLDILVTADIDSPVMDRFVAYDEVDEVASQGETRATVILRAGLQVDLRVVEEAAFGAALHYFTGSKAHNIAVRRLGQQRGLKINEYGVFRDDQRVAGRSEEEVYAAVDLPFIAPELREDSGEIEAAQHGKLPRLVELADLRGDLHCHTNATDGRNSLREMVQAAREEGLDYLAITDHSQRLRVAKGQDRSHVLAQLEEIQALDEELADFTVMAGTEVDILPDGSLDLPDEVLARLDVVIAAVHSEFDLPRQRQTERLLRALDNRYVGILAHPSGRLIQEREAYDVDMGRIIRAARDGVRCLELDASPERLDLDDVHCRMARDEGVLVSIDSDAHHTLGFGNLRFGIGQARRGWLGPNDVLNTRSAQEVRRLLTSQR